ncbi:hypothetical protein NFI96_021649, partial [Prochilodus magdalenae]
MLPCYVESPIPLDELGVEWRRADSETLVHLFLEGESNLEVQDQTYSGRTSFFTEEVKRGNFSLLLTNLTTKDAGVYNCSVYRQQETGHALVDIEYLIATGGQAVSPHVGEDVTLTCSVVSHIPPEELEEVIWTKVDEDITVLVFQEGVTQTGFTHERLRDRAAFFGPEEIHKGNFSLRLRDLQKKDKGLYRCEVFSGKFSANATVEIHWRKLTRTRLDVLGPSGLLIVELGGTVMLPCYVEAPIPLDELKVEWRRAGSETLVHLFQDGESRPESQDLTYSGRASFFTEEVQRGNFSLLLTNLTTKDAGVYRCSVDGQWETGQMLVDIEYLIASGGHAVSPYVGEDITLNCSVVSHIPFKELEEVTWTKVDQDLTVLVLQEGVVQTRFTHERFRDRVEFFGPEETHKGNLSLRLKNVKLEDGGLYRCKVLSGELSANTTVEILQSKLT